MVIIRLARHGTRNAPFYHLTVADRANRRDGRHIERVGFYNPLARGKSERLRIDLDRVDYWLSVGAKPSERVDNVREQPRAAAKAGAGAAPAA